MRWLHPAHWAGRDLADAPGMPLGGVCWAVQHCARRCAGCGVLGNMLPCAPPIRRAMCRRHAGVRWPAILTNSLADSLANSLANVLTMHARLERPGQRRPGELVRDPGARVAQGARLLGLVLALPPQPRPHLQHGRLRPRLQHVSRRASPAPNYQPQPGFIPCDCGLSPHVALATRKGPFYSFLETVSFSFVGATTVCWLLLLRHAHARRLGTLLTCHFAHHPHHNRAGLAPARLEVKPLLILDPGVGYLFDVAWSSKVRQEQ